MMPDIGAYSYAPGNVHSRVGDMHQTQVTMQDFVLPEYLDYTAVTSSLDMTSVPAECFSLSFRGPPSPPDEDEVEQRLARSRHSLPQDSPDCRGLGVLNVPPLRPHSDRTNSQQFSQPTLSPNLAPDDSHDKSKARKDPRYSAPPDKDGFFRCPLVEHSGCTHKPTKQRCIYAKYLDSHLRPYKCKNPACIAEGDDARFSSNACLFRHEREAHGMHCHGMNPYLCKFANCPRSRPDNGFPRSWNQRDHMKRVHQWVPEKGDEDGAGGRPVPEPKRRKGTSVPCSVPMKRSDSSRYARATGLSRYSKETRRSVSSCLPVGTYRPLPTDKVVVYDPSMMYQLRAFATPMPAVFAWKAWKAWKATWMLELIIVTGLPCAGKTHRAQQLAEYLTHRIASDPSSAKRTVVTVLSHHAALDASSSAAKPTRLRDQVYNSAAQEKTARAEEFSAIKRALSRDCIVVADSLNYIKGYRYQLWCEAKAAATRCCVVHAAASEHQCREWNEQRLIAWGRQDEIDSSGDQQDQKEQNAGGKDVAGDLVPESHTTLYGDRNASGYDSRLSISGPPAASATAPSSEPAEQAAAEPSWLPSAPTPPPSSSPPYSPSTLSSLMMRYEPPSPFTRWDTPLFTIPSTDAHLPYAAIWDALYPPPAKPTSKKALAQQAASAAAATTTKTAGSGGDSKAAVINSNEVRRHQATILPTATSADALQTLESSTLLVVQTLLRQARELGMADGDGGTLTLSISLPASKAGDGPNNIIDTDELSIPSGTVLSQPMLQRLRRKYTQIQRTSISHGQGYAGQTDGRRGVVDGFVQFLRLEFQGSD
ncbi:hypothetical protein DV735_g3361, partial [Chaetothyriales sp. CBS 134920]